MSETLPQTQLEQSTHQPEQLVDPALAHQASVGGLRRFIQRFKRDQIGQPSTAEEISSSEPLSEIPVTETAPSLTAEFAESLDTPETPASPEFQFLSGLLSAESLEAKKQGIDDMIASAPDLLGYASLYDAKIKNARDYYEAYQAGDQELSQQLNADAAELRDTEEAYDRSTINRYDALRTERFQIEKNGNITLASTEPAAVELLKLIDVPIAPRDESAPFANYAENDGSAWQVVDKAEVVSYLEKIPFGPEARTEAGTVKVEPSDGEAFDVPISLLTHATGFDSWKGRHGSQKAWNSTFGAGSMRSLNVIKHYAGLSTELPPVGEVRVIVQPDGKVYCDNGSGDSHRIAAALLRGDSTIKANRLDFVRATENVI